MNNDTYLNFLHKLVKTNQIKEKTKISNFLKDKKIKQKDITRKEIKTELFICEIFLENNKILLLKDLPINFIISYTILIGDKCELIEFEIERSELSPKQETRKYICEKKLLETINKHIKIKQNTIKTVMPKELFNKKYFTKYEQPKIVKNLKEYTTTIKKLKFNKIHLIKSNDITNFVPNVKKQHLELAKTLNLPTVPLIKNNFIKETTINIYDNQKLSNILKPIIVETEPIIWNIYTHNKLRLYKDISREFQLIFQKDKIIESILQCPKVNFNKDSIIKQIKNLKNIELSANHGKYPLPIWKSKNEQKFINIENTKHFKEISGVEFKLNPITLNSIYIQTLSGEEAIYKNKFLKQELESCIESLKQSKQIEFQNIKELTIQLIYNEDSIIEQIIQKEKINTQKIEEVINITKHIIQKIILYSINYNQTPKYKKAQNIYEYYFLSISNSINSAYNSYENYPSKRILIKTTSNLIKNLNLIIKQKKPTPSELYYISNCLINLLKTLKIIEAIETKKIEKKFYDYFKNFEIIKEIKISDPTIEKVVNDITKTNNLSKKHKTYIITKKEISKNFFTNSTIISEEPEHLLIIKPNKKKIKEVFKYAYDEILDQLQRAPLYNLEDKNAFIKINKSKIKIREDFLIYYKQYKNYKVPIENKYFKVLIKK